MDWIKQRVWQLGAAIILLLTGAVIIYTNRTGDSGGMLWTGLVLVFIALAVPLLSKAFNPADEKKDEG